MDLVFSSDNRFVEPLATAIRSVQYAHPNSGDLVIWVLSLGIEEKNIELLAESFPDMDLRFLRVDPELTRRFPQILHFGKATYCRFFMGDLLPDSVSRILYLDADILVRRPLLDLFQLDMEGFTVAACRDQGLPVAFNGLLDCERFGIPPYAPYFNAGVLMVDLDSWRRFDMKERTIDALISNAKTVRFPDQDALNIVLKGEFKELDPSLNQQASLRSGSHFCWAWLEPDSVQEAVSNPHVVHFTGPDKPWNSPADVQFFAEWVRLRRTLELFPEFRLNTRDWFTYLIVRWRIIIRKIRNFLAR